VLCVATAAAAALAGCHGDEDASQTLMTTMMTDTVCSVFDRRYFLSLPHVLIMLYIKLMHS